MSVFSEAFKVNEESIRKAKQDIQAKQDIDKVDIMVENKELTATVKITGLANFKELLEITKEAIDAIENEETKNKLMDRIKSLVSKLEEE